MWKYITENEKWEICRIASEKNPAFTLMTVLVSLFCFIFSVIMGFIDIIPGEGDLRPWPEMNILTDRFNAILPYCLAFSSLVFIGTYLRFKFMKPENRIKYEYKKIFSSNDKLCVKCGKISQNGLTTCPECNIDMEPLKNYLWQD